MNNGRNEKRSNDMENSEKPVYPMRINKYLAQHKYSTRRGADEIIEKKQVFINGRLAVLGDKVNENDNVEVRFRGKQKPLVYIAYNKPKGISTDSSQRGETGIKHAVALRDVFPVGRLDRSSHGLLILTNDGRITERLTGPNHFYEKEYVIKTINKLRNNFKQKMEEGVMIDGEMTAPCKIQIINENTFQAIMTESGKHQIGAMCSALFQEVEDLKRTRIINIQLGSLPEGSYRKIEGQELETFLQKLDL
ncbi:MAG: pseudouridine synthase [Candidatus Paceibacterota bacterium]